MTPRILVLPPPALYARLFPPAMDAALRTLGEVTFHEREANLTSDELAAVIGALRCRHDRLGIADVYRRGIGGGSIVEANRALCWVDQVATATPGVRAWHCCDTRRGSDGLVGGRVQPAVYPDRDCAG